MAERRYSLTKLGPGDYLLPSNDGETLWRIATYTDGPSFGLDDWPRDRTFWGAWRYDGRMRWREGVDDPEALLDCNDWSGPVDTYLATRREAIAGALKG
jgi:hypothetical protein